MFYKFNFFNDDLPRPYLRVPGPYPRPRIQYRDSLGEGRLHLVPAIQPGQDQTQWKPKNILNSTVSQ